MNYRAAEPEGQLWVEPGGSDVTSQTAGIGASRSLSVCIWNGSSCPGAELRDHLRERREVGWETVLAGHPTTANSGIREDGTKR
jgi:hypothetical protein